MSQKGRTCKSIGTIPCYYIRTNQVLPNHLRACRREYNETSLCAKLVSVIRMTLHSASCLSFWNIAPNVEECLRAFRTLYTVAKFSPTSVDPWCTEFRNKLLRSENAERFDFVTRANEAECLIIEEGLELPVMTPRLYWFRIRLCVSSSCIHA